MNTFRLWNFNHIIQKKKKFSVIRRRTIHNQSWRNFGFWCYSFFYFSSFFWLYCQFFSIIQLNFSIQYLLMTDKRSVDRERKKCFTPQFIDDMMSSFRAAAAASCLFGRYGWFFLFWTFIVWYSWHNRITIVNVFIFFCIMIDNNAQEINHSIVVHYSFELWLFSLSLSFWPSFLFFIIYYIIIIIIIQLRSNYLVYWIWSIFFWLSIVVMTSSMLIDHQ